MSAKPPVADNPEGLRWWARRCENYGGLERAFDEAADAMEKLMGRLDETTSGELARRTDSRRRPTK